jgi:hypothetical protein
MFAIHRNPTNPFTCRRVADVDADQHRSSGDADRNDKIAVQTTAGSITRGGSFTDT